MSIKQDGCVPRTPLDVDRRYKAVPGDVERIQEQLEGLEIDSSLSISSTNPVQNKVITEALNAKVPKVAGKDLSSNDFTDAYKNKIDNITTTDNNFTDEYKNTLDNLVLTDNNFTDEYKSELDNLVTTDNNFTDDYKSQIDENTEDRHTHSNKSVLDGITSTKVNTWDNSNKATSYNLSSYKVSGLTILRSSCVEKNNRVCMNFVGTLSMNANTTTTLFNLPANLRPTSTRDFVVFGQSSNTDGYIGYGYVTSDGLLQVRFNEAISSYMRFSAVYDLD